MEMDAVYFKDTKNFSVQVYITMQINQKLQKQTISQDIKDILDKPNVHLIPKTQVGSAYHKHPKVFIIFQIT